MGSTVDPDSVKAELERIVSSPPLETSPSLCRFLRYVVEETLAGRGGSLKEYSLGVVVFERGDAFDPRLDPIVRVQARNLRVRLAQYYARGGAQDPLLIELPKRTYVPVFQDRPSEPEAPLPVVEQTRAPGAEPPAPRLSWLSGRRAIGAVAALLAVIAVAVAFRYFAAPWSPARSAAEPSPAAQDLYIRGRYMMDRQSEAALRESIASFRQAVAHDPGFAAAWAGMSQAHNMLAQYGYIPPAEGMGEARRLARQSLDRDPSLAEGHVALAAVMEAYDWDWRAAESEYRKALRLNPSAAVAHLWYGMFLRDQGRVDEGLAELRRAAQLEPFSVLTTVNLASAYMEAGNHEAAEQQAQHAVELAPQIPMTHLMLASVYLGRKKSAESIGELERARALAGDNPHALASLASAYACRDMRAVGVELQRQLQELARHRYVSPYDLGTVSLRLGDETRALDLLREAYRQRSSGLIFLRGAKFAGLQHSAEFRSLVELMRFAG